MAEEAQPFTLSTMKVVLISAGGLTMTIDLPATAVTVTTTQPVAPAPPKQSVTATDITDTTANLKWTPVDATVTMIGRSADSVNGAWQGSPTLLPFKYLQPGTSYTLWAIVDGVRVETQMKTMSLPFTLTATQITTTSANLTWTPADANVVEVGCGDVKSGPPSILPFTGLKPDTPYTLWAVVDET